MSDLPYHVLTEVLMVIWFDHVQPEDCKKWHHRPRATVYLTIRQRQSSLNSILWNLHMAAERAFRITKGHTR